MLIADEQLFDNDTALLPRNYSEWDLSEKIDFQLEHFTSACVKWIEAWLDAAGSRNLLLTQYEVLHRSPQAFFDRILDFYGISTAIEPLPVEKGAMHYRRGMIDEWQTVFSEAQQQVAETIVPQEMRRRFGWP